MARLGTRLLILALLALAAAACSGEQRANKSGASVRRTLTLRLELTDAGDPEASFFARDVSRRSGGALKLEIDPTAYADVRPANELALARNLEAGKAEVAYLPARAWAADGLPAFEALLAPFAITTFGTTSALAAGRLGHRILATLPQMVVGVGLVPGEPRRVLANRPPLTPAAFRGLRIRVVDNPEVAAGFRSLGARPAEGLTNARTVQQLSVLRLDAVESSPMFILPSGYARWLRDLSGYAMFPRLATIVASRGVWDRLSSRQQSALREAAADTLADARRRVPRRELAGLDQLCQTRVRVVVPTAAQLAALVRDARPAVARLMANPTAARTVAALRTLPGAGPHRLASPLPTSCRSSSNLAGRAEGQRGEAAIPSGVYVVTETGRDWRRGDVTNFKVSITYKTWIRDGRWYQIQTPNYPDQGPFSGIYRIHGDRVTFVMLKAGAHGQNSVSGPETVRWSYFDGRLTFHTVTPEDPGVSVADPDSRVIYFAHPWRKVG